MFLYHVLFAEKHKHGRPLCFCVVCSFWKKKSTETNVALVDGMDVDETECNGDDGLSSEYVNTRYEELHPEMKKKISVR